MSDTWKTGDIVYHNQNGETIQSYFTRYCADPTKAVVDDGESWDKGYEVVKVSDLRKTKA